jgi:hypothetical protein
MKSSCTVKNKAMSVGVREVSGLESIKLSFVASLTKSSII